MHLADFMRAASVIKNAFRRGGFAGVNMRDNTDVSDFV
jgi:hypothetical protein